MLLLYKIREIKIREMENQVRYNCRRAESDIENLEWWFLIINDDGREVQRVQTEIFKLLAMVDEESPFISGRSHGLNYRLLNFESRKRAELDEILGIYKKMIKDPNLYRREDAKLLETYVLNLVK